MQNINISCPGGASSQSGAAVRNRYPQAGLASCKDIPEVAAKFEAEGGDYVVPIWNSHQGEVGPANFVWNLIEEARIKLLDIWSQRIEFWFVKRSGVTSSHGKIGSVGVAQTQCSNFLQTRRAELVSRGLTTIAHEEFRGGAEWDGVLVAPGQGEDEEGYEVANKETANSNNFTTFVRLTSSRGARIENAKFWLSGVAMRPLSDFLGEAEQSFFEQLFNTANELDEMPRLIFVFKRTAKVGLLFEGNKLYAGDLLNAEELDRGDIYVYEEAGALSNLYTEELSALFGREFSELLSDDFILHRGVNACLFACPILGMYTHGYEVETVEPVVRFYISKLFELIDNGAVCTTAQLELFERYKGAWLDSGSEFMQFKVVGV